MFNKKRIILFFLCFITFSFNPNTACGHELKALQNPKKKSNVSVLVDLMEQKLYVIDTEKNVIVKEYWIASGKSETPSPVGTWKIISKGEWSGGFGTRWLGLNVPWGRYGIHGTNRPGSIGQEASHGCIRMFNEDVEELYKMVNYGTIVVIYGGPNGPFYRGFRTLTPGDRGGDVYYIQRMLKGMNYYDGQLDGIYGEQMKKWVIKFREDRGLVPSHDIDWDFYKSLGIKRFE